jgi:aminomethyltransferase
MKHSPLDALHVELGAKMVDFAGWRMPIQYAGILREHETVRNAVGVFDISHMGEIFLRGPGAGAWLNRMLTNNTAKLAVGEGHYTLMLNARGGVIDDLIVYRTAPEEYLLVVNASLAEEDVAWLRAHGDEGVEIDDRCAAFGALAIQGPKAVALFEKMTLGREALPARNRVARMASPGGEAFVCRTGYTGEDGFELFCPAEDTEHWMRKALAEGAELGVSPCGLGARDTLRLEMGYPLNGSDLSPERTPLQAGLGFFVDLEKGEFAGRSALAAEKAAGDYDRLVAIRMDAKGPPLRPHYAVCAGGETLGELCSGTLSPTLGIGIGMAYLPGRLKAPGTELEIDIRGKRFPAKTVKKPFIPR